MKLICSWPRCRCESRLRPCGTLQLSSSVSRASHLVPDALPVNVCFRTDRPPSALLHPRSATSSQMATWVPFIFALVQAFIMVLG